MDSVLTVTEEGAFDAQGEENLARRGPTA